jgi:hypothetical protein
MAKSDFQQYYFGCTGDFIGKTFETARASMEK